MALNVSTDPTVKTGIGTATSRIDGRAKVTGAALYGSDFTGGENPAYAFLVLSPIARGTITKIDDTKTRKVAGFIELFTYRNIGDKVKPGKIFQKQGFLGTSIAPLASDQIWHGGQIVAVVVAETFEAARQGAHDLHVEYHREEPSAGFDSNGITLSPAIAQDGSEHENPTLGDANAMFVGAAVKVDAEYETPAQHHNPIELFTTACSWKGDKLTVWESSQNVYGFQNGLAEQLGIDPANVRVVSPFVGGAFGSRGSLTQRTALIAHASKVIDRPIKLETTRQQGFTVATYRAETRHRVRLGASTDGKLLALTHEGWEVSSRPDDYSVAGTDASTRLYGAASVASKVSIVHADRNTPGFMRSPPEVPYLFALESAMDELAYALKMDPIELRRVNDIKNEPIKGLPYTSRNLMPCFDQASKAFEWSRRDPRPTSMSEGDWLIGLGCATTMYPTQQAPATARVTLMKNGEVKVQCATHEIGNGVRTAIALTVVSGLGVSIEKVEVETGVTDYPPAPVAGGSNSTASVCNVVAKACDEIRKQIISAAANTNDNVFRGVDPQTVSFTNGSVKAQSGQSEDLSKVLEGQPRGAWEAYAENVPHGAPPASIGKLYQGHSALVGGSSLKDRIQFAFGAQFVEIRVNKRTCEIRVPRLVGAYSAGTIVNPKAAKSQLMGGQIWGISSALHEATEIDRRHARYYNNDLAEYLVPVNADIESVETIFVPEEDRQVNDLGIKGLGELGNVGLNAAVANAVYHATGKRIRKLPIRIDHLLDTVGI